VAHDRVPAVNSRWAAAFRQCVRAPGSSGALAAAACLAGALLLATADARATRDRPPTAHTGAFGEPTCQTCHFDSDLDAGAGRLLLAGVPDPYVPGREYRLTVVLVEIGLNAAGFQLTARFHDGHQAGALMPGPAERHRLDVTTDRNIQYAHHIYAGTMPLAPDTARWEVLWTAPADSPEPVVFHVVGNAADDDMSPLGDFIYTASARSRPFTPAKADPR
jgi:hypothetical protein